MNKNNSQSNWYLTVTVNRIKKSNNLIFFCVGSLILKPGRQSRLQTGTHPDPAVEGAINKLKESWVQFLND